MDDRGVPEADVDGGRTGDAVERGVERREAVLAGRLGPRLHVRLIDLDQVGTGRVQVLDLGVDRGGVRHRRRLEVGIVVVLRLLRHGERAGHGHLDRVVGVRLKKSTSRTPTGSGRTIGPAIRGTGLGWPLRSRAVPGLSMSTPSRAVAK